MIVLFICQALNPRHFTAEGIETRRFLLICRAALVPSERRFARIIPASLEGATGMAMHLDHFSISSPNLYYGVHQCVWRGPFRAASAGLKAPRHRIRKPH